MSSGGHSPAGAAAPVSPARLAAEAAFAIRPAVAAPVVQAQIIVRRPRLPRPVLSAVPAPPAEPSCGADAADAVPSKPARVFRLEPALPAGPAAALPEPASEPGAPVGAEAARARPARRRRSPDQRPGPVRHAVLSVPQAPPEAAAAPSAAQRLKDLGQALARLDPVFEEIQRARAFVFVDAGFDPAWKALAKRAERLRAELHAPRPWHR